MEVTDEVVSTAEAARILGRSVSTVHRLTETGRLPVAKQLGGRGVKLYHRADVEKLRDEELQERWAGEVTA